MTGSLEPEMSRLIFQALFLHIFPIYFSAFSYYALRKSKRKNADEALPEYNQYLEEYACSKIL